MAEKLSLDVQELFCPEPVEVILQAVDALTQGQYLEVLHHREPVMLFPLLQERGFACHCLDAGPCYKLWVWRSGDEAAAKAAAAEFGGQGA